MLRKNDGVTFEADGRAWTLRFDVNALCDLEDHTGIGVNNIGSELAAGNIKLGFVRACYWAGLRRSKPNITTAEAGELIGELGIERAGELLTAAMNAAFPTPAKDNGGAENPPNPPLTGTAS